MGGREVKMDALFQPRQLIFIYLFLFICVHVSKGEVCARVCKYSRRPGGGIRSPEAGVTGGYEAPNMGARNKTQVL